MILKEHIQIYGIKRRILLQMSEFICVLPHPSLQAYISNYNITFPSKTLMPDSFTIMPCGCSTISIEKSNDGLHVYLDGSITKPYNAGKESSQLEMMISIEFRPAGLYAITGINQSELTDKTFPLDEINPALAKSILEITQKSDNICELVEGLDLLFMANIRTVYRPELMMALHDIKAYAGNISVKQLSNNIHYSERQLNRIFNQFVGTGTKSFSRIIRINNTFRLLKNGYKSLDYISGIAGFHDLSHFINDFKLTCGVTPQEYRKNMSDFYSNPVKL